MVLVVARLVTGEAVSLSAPTAAGREPPPIGSRNDVDAWRGGLAGTRRRLPLGTQSSDAPLEEGRHPEDLRGGGDGAGTVPRWTIGGGPY